VINDARDQHDDSEGDKRNAELARRLITGNDPRCSECSNALAIVKPKLMSESEVRITDIRVRSADMRVR
jgi:hypothetical protein